MSDPGLEIRERFLHVKEQIADAAESSGRNAADVRLVVVSKAQPMFVMEAAVEAGIRVFGENYPEEGYEKIHHFRGVEGIEWHMIGHLQSRKARLVAESFQWLHSLDSLRLAEKLNIAVASLTASQKPLQVIIEMNVSGEESKFGWLAWNANQWGSLVPEIEQLGRFSHLRIRGLMTMPPYSEDPEQARPYFAKLRQLRDFLEGSVHDLKLPELSMGTSADFQSAVKEGATFVRVGQAILGSRPARRV